MLTKVFYGRTFKQLLKNQFFRHIGKPKILRFFRFSWKSRTFPAWPRKCWWLSFLFYAATNINKNQNFQKKSGLRVVRTLRRTIVGMSISVSFWTKSLPRSPIFWCWLGHLWIRRTRFWISPLLILPMTICWRICSWKLRRRLSGWFLNNWISLKIAKKW